MRQLREEDGLKQDKKLSSIVEKTLEKLEDRVENGDYILNSKFGTIERIPLKARDIHRIASDFMDKREEIKKLFDAPKQDTNEGVNGRLLKLAEEFASLIHGSQVDISKLAPVLSQFIPRMMEQMNNVELFSKSTI